MQVNRAKKLTKFIPFITLLILSTVGLSLFSKPSDFAQAQGLFDEPSNNLIRNGDFESGFYPVPELGFEPPDVGQVPIDWHWFKNNAFGKYNIYNQEGFGLTCSDDDFSFLALNSLSINMQSTDQPDARLGVYQTVEVVPGQDYRFSMKGTVQSMQGSPEKSDFSHKVELVFDQSGGDDWQAIPNEQWTRLPWGEYLLEFKTSGPDDPDIAKIEDYETIVRAQSNKLTIFIAAWRQWPDWRSVRYTLDCISLVPLNPELGTPAQTQSLFPNNLAAPTADSQSQIAPVESVAQAESAEEITAQTETEATDETATTPAEKPAIIPDSGGVLKNSSHTLWNIMASVIVILSLLGAGFWNIRRKRIS